MPKRTTLTFTSEDAPLDAPQDRLLVYYCKYTGKHAFTIGKTEAATSLRVVLGGSTHARWP